MRIGFLIAALALGTTLGTGPAAAQSASEQELLKRFQTHQQVHRGLSLAPVVSGSAASTAAGQTTAATTAGTSGASTGGTTAQPARTQPGTQAAAVPRDTLYTAMPEEAQINIRIQFEYDSAVLRPSEFAKLQTLCNAIKQSDVELFRIFGHTDSSGSDRYNLNLSKLRAEEVRRHMVENCGIAPGRLEAIGVGEQYPLTGTAPSAPDNRRVEFQAIS